MNRDFMELMADLEIVFGLIMAYSLGSILIHLDISIVPIYVIIAIFIVKDFVSAWRYHSKKKED